MENPNEQAIVRTLVSGVKTEYAIMAGEDDEDVENDKLNKEDNPIIEAVGEIVNQYKIPVGTPLQMSNDAVIKVHSDKKTRHLQNGRRLYR